MAKPSSVTGHQRKSARSREQRSLRTASKLFEFDRSFENRFIAGVDEAGRGSLAGPLVAAAVLFDYEKISRLDIARIKNLNDSKTHTHEAREELLPLVLSLAVKVAVVAYSAGSIDSRGLHKTNLVALQECLRQVSVEGCLCLVDGFELSDLGHRSLAVIDGDARSAAVAAASVVAKVSRDRFMHRAEKLHPGWGFAAHVGYSTPEHRAAINTLGVSPLHRLSFRSVAYQQLELDRDGSLAA